MKSLLIRLTHGLYNQDISDEERPYIETWLNEHYILYENGKYQFSSHYRAGSIGLLQSNGAYLHAIGESLKDHFIDATNLKGAKQDDLVIAQRLLGKRGGPQAKVVLVVGRSQTYSIGVVTNQNGQLILTDLRTLHPIGLEIHLLENFHEGAVYQINNQNQSISTYLGDLSDPKVDEKIVLAQYNKHDAFDEEVCLQAQSFPKNVVASNYPHRIDLRHLPFCTIDPVTAKDYDDAICYIPETNTLYVAIADVSEYVKPFGAVITSPLMYTVDLAHAPRLLSRYSRTSIGNSRTV